MARSIVICGYGPGISSAVAERFGRAGFAVALVGRTEERLLAGAAALGKAGITAKAFPCNVGDPEAVRTLITNVHDSLGPIGVLHWNAYPTSAGDLTTASIAELRTVFDVAVHGLVSAMQQALPDLKREHGAILVTGGGLAFYDPSVDAMAVQWSAMGLSLAKAAQHKLVGVLNRKLEPEGVYVGEVTVLSLVKGTPFDTGKATLEPSAVADKFWEIYERRSDVSVTIS